MMDTITIDIKKITIIEIMIIDKVLNINVSIIIIKQKNSKYVNHFKTYMTSNY